MVCADRRARIFTVLQTSHNAQRGSERNRLSCKMIVITGAVYIKHLCFFALGFIILIASFVAHFPSICGMFCRHYKRCSLHTRRFSTATEYDGTGMRPQEFTVTVIVCLSAVERVENVTSGGKRKGIKADKCGD